MTKHDALVLLRELSAPYPNVVLTKEFMRGWYESALRERTLTDAREIVRSLQGDHTFMPRPAEFNQRWRELFARRHTKGTEQPKDEPAHPETSKRFLAEMREKLAQAKGPLAETLRRTTDANDSATDAGGSAGAELPLVRGGDDPADPG